MSAPCFDDLTDVYEALIDWPTRLANEQPFYRGLFEDHAVRSVVDVACGTGRHAAMFHSWGLRVEGSDLSSGMIAHARRLHGQPPGLRWVVRGFDQPIACAEPFDAAICVGNSLALADDPTTVRRAIHQMLAAVRPGGIVVVQVLNLWRLPDGPVLWQKCQSVKLEGRDVVILKGVHRSGLQGYVDLVVIEPSDSAQMHSQCVSLVGLEAAELERAAADGGATHIAFCGGYQQQPYQRADSVDLIMVARR